MAEQLLERVGIHIPHSHPSSHREVELFQREALRVLKELLRGRVLKVRPLQSLGHFETTSDLGMNPAAAKWERTAATRSRVWAKQDIGRDDYPDSSTRALAGGGRT